MPGVGPSSVSPASSSRMSTSCPSEMLDLQLSCDQPVDASPGNHTKGRRSLEELLTIREVARRTALSRSKIYEMVTAGQIPAISIGRSRRVRAAALDEWIREQAERQEPVTTR